MTNEELNNDFNFIKKLKGAKIEGNKIYLPFLDTSSDYCYRSSFFSVVAVCGFVLLIPGIFYSILKFIDIFRPFFVKNTILMFLVIMSGFFLPPLILVSMLVYLFRSYKVIDFDKGLFYTKQYEFGISKTFDFIEFKDIAIICNNVIPQETLPFVMGRKRDINSIGLNPNTKFFHNYYLSFLLKNGKLIDFIRLGYSGTEHKLSLRLAEKLARYLNTDLEECEDYCIFKAEQIGDESNPVFKLNKKKITEKDLVKYDNPESFIVLISIVLTIPTVIILIAIFDSIKK